MLFYIRVNTLGVTLYSLINVNTGGRIIGIAVWNTRMLSRILNAFVKSFLFPSLTTLFDCVGVIVVIVNWIAFNVLYY